MTKHHTKAPLPFVGQKRNFIKTFKNELNNIPADGAGWTIVDAFGGSGLPAHVAKHTKPAARVVYNDFDGYTERLRHIPDTNRLRQTLAAVLADYPRDKHLDKPTQSRVVAAIRNFNGYKDLNCLRSWLLLSSNQAGTMAELFDKHMYNGIRRSDYPDAQDYLRGLEIVSQPFQTLLPQYIGKPQTLLVFDPPYVSTMQGMYANKHYFGMVRFLQLMRLVRPPFVFFSSTRSELMDYLDFLEQYRPIEWTVFDGVTSVKLITEIAKKVGYEDNMIFKFD
ncbi:MULTISPECIES: hypothetical protein [unclassified Neisseria]|uniref:hypothetical protein n=1 Tax=unclassified Neisseria TaxID=2623750 RepID=UPI001072464A|nr:MULTISPECIES: hypothetical protein [unclassified Neisseria]TFU39242.1 hypothetical protein E4T99_12135 [Neisseria sp. WF04]